MKRFKNILCVLEHGEAGKPALDRAVSLAEHNQANLTVVDVIPRMSDDVPMSGELQPAILREHEARMQALVEGYRQRLDIPCKVLLGTSFLEVIREVLRNQHDLVIKCPESPSWLDRFFSGDDMHLLRKCPCPVWFVKLQPQKNYQRILAAVDIGDDYPAKELETRHRLNVQILEMAASLAASESAELHIVHAWESMSEFVSGFAFSSDISSEKIAANNDQERSQHQRLLNEFISDLKSNSHDARDILEYLQPQTHLLKGAARQKVPGLATRLQVDCLVMGTVARTGIRGFFMGNTAETILEQIDCSVLAIKPQEFTTPVTLDES